MLVGALSSNAYGIARSTNDADIVVSFETQGVVEFCEQLGSKFRLDRQMQLETITGSVRNVLVFKPTGFEIELFRLNDDPHHQQRFARRRRQWISEIGTEAWIPAVEDVVIQKLRWGRPKDIDDVMGVIGVSGKKIDWKYVKKWATEHETFVQLQQIREQLRDTQ